MLNVNEIVPALCAAIVACDPTRRWHCCCGRPDCSTHTTGPDRLHDALTRVCRALDMPEPGPLRAEMEWERVRRELVRVLEAATFANPWASEVCMKAGFALALATEGR